MAGLGRSNSLSINTSGTSLFGNNASQGQQSGSLFGSTSQPPPSQSLFGAQNTTSQPQSTGLFSNLNKPAATPAPAAGGGLFGSSAAQTQSQPQQSTSLFGGALGAGANTQAQSQPSQSGGLFGGSQAQKPSLFGGATSGTQQQNNTSLFGNTTTQQNQTSAPSLFGSNQQNQPQQQQQSNTMFPNLQSQNKPLGGLGAPGLSMSTAQAVQIQAADSIKGTTRFNDLSPEFQQQIIQIEEQIQRRINHAHSTRGTLPQHIEQVASIAPDVELVEKLLSTVELGLDNDSANIAYIKKQVKKDADDATLSFRAIENQALPPQFRYGNASNLTTSTAKPTSGTSLDDDDPTKPVDLLDYFDRRAENLASTLDLYQRQIREIETHLRTMEAGTLEKAQQLTGSRSSSHDQRKQLVDALKGIEGAILQSASKVAYGSLTEITLNEFLYAWAPAKKSEVPHHDSYNDLLQAVLEGCWICRNFWRRLLDSADYQMGKPKIYRKLPDDADAIASESRILENWGFARSPTRMNLEWYHDDDSAKPSYCMKLGFTDPWDPDYFNVSYELRPLPEGHEISGNNVLDPCNTTLWNHWLHTCLSSHKECRALSNTAKSFTPTRLVEISSQDNGTSFQWKIVSLSGVPYLTLSHCWGSSSHTSLTTDNYARFSSQLCESSLLPKTFQHAFFITFSLGHRFLWIDSLCIIQDNEKDWQNEASMMGTVYANSRCNIAAAWASNGDDGCFVAKDQDRLPVISLGGSSGPEQQQHKVYSITPGTPLSAYEDEVTHAPLYTRGWVVQERYLSRRQLIFTRGQVYWECASITTCEHLPKSHNNPSEPIYSAFELPRKPSLLEPSSLVWTKYEHRKAWVSLVEYFSRCQFSRPSDRLIALAGLSQSTQHALNDTYLAGLWKQNLRYQLTWAVNTIDTLLPHTRRRIPSYLGPTWSWVSLNAPILVDVMYYLDEDPNPHDYIEILRVAAPSKHPSGLYDFEEPCTLVLRGLALWVRIVGRNSRPDNTWEKADIYTSEPTNGDYSTPSQRLRFFSAYWDEAISSHDDNDDNDDAARLPEPHLLMVTTMSVNLGGARGLILKRKTQGDDIAVDQDDQEHFVRAGVFKTDPEDFYEVVSALVGRSGDDDEKKAFTGYGSILEDTGSKGLVRTVTVV
ncbi:HET-domain-containing protein [Periconia macrospinosa]|uniref:HET-domain-containing protein n=1 Tax=Periconia macrospinosa TaxID=97972 RepID=A0A2V1E1W2_9PLEO|nr:HET-domain-containing protein [Periconia macrospinosa]